MQGDNERLCATKSCLRLAFSRVCSRDNRFAGQRLPIELLGLVYKDERGGGRVVRWCWVNFQCRGVLLIWIRVGQGPTALAVGAGGGCLNIFTLVYHFSFLSPSHWKTA